MARGAIAPVIELYLPPSAGKEGVVQAAQRAYGPLLHLLERKRGGAALTLALDPALATELIRCGQAGILHAIAALADRGPIELAAGSLNHALLPRLPRAEVERQLTLGDERLREMLGRVYRPQGLVPPALAYGRVVAEAAKARGLRWLLLDEIALGEEGRAPTRRTAVLPGKRELALYFRDRRLSAEWLTPLDRGEDRLFRRFGDGYRVLWLPAERFLEASAPLVRLERLLDGDGPLLSTLSALGNLFPDREPVEPLPSSHRTTAEQLAGGVPFAVWSAPDNELQALLWRLLTLGQAEAARLTREAWGAPETARLRVLVDEGQHSAPFRHASLGADWDGAAVLAAAGRLASAVEAGGALVRREVQEEARALQRRIEEAVAYWGKRLDAAAVASAQEER